LHAIPFHCMLSIGCYTIHLVNVVPSSFSRESWEGGTYQPMTLFKE